jgi:hypothetical protein
MALQISSAGLLADVVDWYEDVVGLLRAEVHGAQPQARDFQAGTAEMCVPPHPYAAPVEIMCPTGSVDATEQSRFSIAWLVGEVEHGQ